MDRPHTLKRVGANKKRKAKEKLKGLLDDIKGVRGMLNKAPKHKRLDRMIKLSAKRHKRLIPRSKLRRLRSNFNRMKQDLCPLPDTCFCCDCKATVRHHIIELQYGGLNKSPNIVPLCELCHLECHPWMEPSAELVSQTLNTSSWSHPELASLSASE